ncbi:MAG: hypothetical protein ACKOBP_06450, partial [Planctomycetia bacterium]
MTTIDNPSGLALTVGQQLLDSSLMQQLQAAKESRNIYLGTNPTMVAFYDSEITRITEELLANGLAEELYNWDTASGIQSVKVGDAVRVNAGYDAAKGGGPRNKFYRYKGTAGSLALGSQDYTNTANWTPLAAVDMVTPVERYVMTVTVGAATAQAGLIDIRADAFVGGGIVNAPRDAAITITNHTPAQLIIAGLTIPEQVGGVFMNGDAVLDKAAINTRNEKVSDVTGATLDTARFTTLTPATAALSGDQGPAITITNTFDGDVWTGTDTYGSPDLVIQGDITNYSGKVTLESQGSVVTKGSIRSGSVSIVAGDTLLVDGASVWGAAGDPYGKLKGRGDGINEYDQAARNLLTTAATAPNVLASTITVNAEYINLNGLIQSGKASYALVIPASVNREIAQIRGGRSTDRLTRLSVSNTDFKVFYDRVDNKIVVREVRSSGGNVQLTGHIVSTGAGEIRVLDGYASVSIDNQTTYDIAVERIDVSQRGAGTLLLADKAKAPSTSTYNTGSGTKTIKQNETVLVNAGYTGGGTPGAVYKFVGTSSLNLGTQNYADTSLWEAVPGARASTYRSTGTRVMKAGDTVNVTAGYTAGGTAGTVYRFIGNAATLNLSAQDYRNRENWIQVPLATLYSPTVPGAILPADGTYTPAANWRYGFSVGMRTATRTTTTYGTSAWLGIDALAADPSNVREGPTKEVISQPKLLPAGTYFYKAASDQGDYTYGSKTYDLEPPKNFLVRKWQTSTWYGKKTYYEKWTLEEKKETVSTHTFRADRPVTINFIGADSGSVSVTSNAGGRILVNGSILNPTGTTTLTASAGIVQTNPGASVGGKSIVLSATQGAIEGRGTTVETAADGKSVSRPARLVTNVADTGGTGLKATASGAITIAELSGSLPIDAIESTGRGTVTLSAPEGITRMSGATASAAVKGGSISLTTTSGGVGTSGTALPIDQGDQGTHVVDVAAKGGIHLREIDGNLRARTIYSTNGDVAITVSAGSLIDANRVETRDERAR